MNRITLAVFLAALLVGCASTDTRTDSSNDTLGVTQPPEQSRVVREGSGQLSYMARDDGRVYLYDVEDRAVVDSRPVSRGQEYLVVPDDNRVTLDGRTVLDRDLKSRHAHRIYFLSEGRFDRDTDHGDRRLPRNAEPVAQGTGELRWRAPSDGHLYVYDADDDRLLFEQRVRRGDDVDVSPERDRIMLDDRTVYERDLVRRHAHRIYFDRD